MIKSDLTESIKIIHVEDIDCLPLLPIRVSMRAFALIKTKVERVAGVMEYYFHITCYFNNCLTLFSNASIIVSAIFGATALLIKSYIGFLNLY